MGPGKDKMLIKFLFAVTESNKCSLRFHVKLLLASLCINHCEKYLLTLCEGTKKKIAQKSFKIQKIKLRWKAFIYLYSL